MKQHNYNDEKRMKVLVSEYEAMSQEGTVGFYEKTVFNRLIEYYEDKNSPEKALEVIEHALSQHCYSVGFYLRKLRLLLDRDSAQEALTCLETAESYAPNNFELQLLKIEALTKLSYYRDVFDLIDRLRATTFGQELAELCYAEAIVFELMDQYERMFFSLQECLRIHPRHERAAQRILWATEFSGKYEESIELHQSIIDEDPYLAAAWYNLGHAYSSLEEFALAIEAFEYAFIIDKGHEYAYRECAETCIQIGRFEKALQCYEEVLEHIEADSDLLTKIGYCYESLNDVNLAKSFYLRAVKIDPQNSEVHFRMGECYSREQRWESAIGCYEKALHLNGRREEYLAAIGEAYFQVDNDEKAAFFFQKAADTAPETTKYWIQYASFLMDTGAIEMALDTLDEAGQFSEGTELLYCRIACLFQLGRRKEALYLLGQALSENFSMHDALFDLIPTLENDRDIKAVIATYRAA
ncbi:MAG: tetratricopeptide repeat protein [Bacteroidota bacterium]